MRAINTCFAVLLCMVFVGCGAGAPGQSVSETPSRTISAAPPKAGPLDLTVEREGDSVRVRFTATLPGDANKDGAVNGQDVFPLAVHFGHESSHSGGIATDEHDDCIDLNRDGTIGGPDLFVIAANFETAIAGARLYRDEDDNPSDGTLVTTLPQPEAPTQPLVCYAEFEYLDENPPHTGEFLYYMARYICEAGGAESPDGNVATAAFLPDGHFYVGSFPTSMGFDSSGDLLVIAAGDSALRRFDAGVGAMLDEHVFTDRSPGVMHIDQAKDFAWITDATPGDARVRKFDLRAWEEVDTFIVGEGPNLLCLNAAESRMHVVCVNPDDGATTLETRDLINGVLFNREDLPITTEQRYTIRLQADPAGGSVLALTVNISAAKTYINAFDQATGLFQRDWVNALWPRVFFQFEPDGGYFRILELSLFGNNMIRVDASDLSDAGSTSWDASQIGPFTFSPGLTGAFHAPVYPEDATEAMLVNSSGNEVATFDLATSCAQVEFPDESTVFTLHALEIGRVIRTDLTG